MSKVYKGYELLKAIADGEIKNNTKIEIKGRFSGDLIGSYFIYNEGALCFPIYEPDGVKYSDEMKMSDLINWEFKLIEDEIEIDIDSIEELENEVMQDDWRYYVPMFFNKINELVPAVKQLNKEIKSIKEK